MLSNVFARIYRIYGYNSRGVSRDDWACTNPQKSEFRSMVSEFEQRVR